MIAGLRSISDSLGAFNIGVAGLRTMIGSVADMGASMYDASARNLLLKRFLLKGGGSGDADAEGWEMTASAVLLIEDRKARSYEPM